MKFTCPHCRQSLETDDSFAGATVDCPACGKAFVVQQGEAFMPPQTVPAAPLRYRCPHCGAVLESEETIAGMQVDCPECGGGFVATPIGPEEKSDGKSKGRFKAQKRFLGLAAMGAGVVLAVVAVRMAGRQPGATKTITLLGGAKMEMAWCPPGTFTMGRPEGEPWRDPRDPQERQTPFQKFWEIFYEDKWAVNKPDAEEKERMRLWGHGEGWGEDDREEWETQHEVTLTKGFWMAKTEVTQAQWKSVMGTNPSAQRGDDLPVEHVSWYDCVAFCQKAGLQLPTEAQWEYACRAGAAGAYAGTGDLDDMGWYRYNSGWRGGRFADQTWTHPVAQKMPNAWGLYDMHGNVPEWCADCSDVHLQYSSDAVTNPAGLETGAWRIVRGGGYWNEPERCRAAFRFNERPDTTSGNGFRPIMQP